MRNHHGGGLLRSCLAIGLLAAATVPVAGQQHIPEDVHLSGKEIHTFDANGQAVSVVLGDFRLKVGGRVVTGRDAVLWINETRVGGTSRREIQAYVEGNAKVTEPGKATTTDQVVMVSLRQQGRLFADGVFSDRPLRDFPLFRRAVAARSKLGSRIREIKRHEPPELIIVPASGRMPGEDDEQALPEEDPNESPTTPQDDQLREIRIQAPVYFRADSLTMRPREEGKAGRIIVAKGNVYLSQGDPDSELFLELRGKSAVVFTGPMRKKDVTSPFAPQLEGFGEGDGDPNSPRETVTGVYLQDDVIIARGERKFSGPVAYYDFTADRALIREPVFRTVQEQRNIPVYIRAKEARMLSVREVLFKDARISTSDFHTPTYHIGAKRAYLMDRTIYAQDGEQLSERRWHGTFEHATFNVRSLPVLYWPFASSSFEEDHTALRTVQLGNDSRLGFGVRSEWHLFRLLGLIRPEGFRSRLNQDYFERGAFTGVETEYARDRYSGYSYIDGLYDREQEDTFGDRRKDIPASRWRGRFLWRHKQYLADDWELQAELSYLCDRNYLEQFHRDEFYAGKEQETLLYAKKQVDNWAVTGLLKTKLNRFDAQDEAAPDLGFYLIGQPLLDNQLAYFNESHLGLVRYRYDNETYGQDSRWFGRVDTRNEINFPFKVGPVNLLAYATGRLTHWGDSTDGGQTFRPYGQVGIKANTHLWKIYDGVDSRLWDVHKLRHIITPWATAFAGEAGNVNPGELFPIDPGIEEHLRSQSGVAFGVRQRLQTKRGPEDDRRTVDWMRLDVTAGFYDNGRDLQPADGRFFISRPEYSLGRNHVNAEYAWYLSDATTFLGDVNYDVDSGRIGRANLGLAVSRDPRLRYYFGWRYIQPLDSSVGTAGVRYRIDEKYTASLFQQYDFDFRGRRNLRTDVTITRKWPRWYSAFSVYFGQDNEGESVGIMLSFWPEGIDEVRLRSSRLDVVDSSDDN